VCFDFSIRYCIDKLVKEIKMNKPIITDEAQYESGLVDLEKLMDLDPPKDSIKGQELIILAKALENYESQHYVVE